MATDATTVAWIWKNCPQLENGFGQRFFGEREVEDGAGAETKRSADDEPMTEASAFCALNNQPERAVRMCRRSERTRRTITASSACWFGRVKFGWINQVFPAVASSETPLSRLCVCLFHSFGNQQNRHSKCNDALDGLPSQRLK